MRGKIEMTVKCSIGGDGALSEIKQARRRIDDDCTIGEIDFVHDFFDSWNQVFFAAAVHDIELTAARHHRGLDDTNALASGRENFEPDDLIMIVLAGREHVESGLCHREGCTDIGSRNVDAVHLAQFDQQLTLMRAACFEQKRRLRSRPFDENFDAGFKRCCLRIERVELQPAEEAMGSDDFTEGNYRFVDRYLRRQIIFLRRFRERLYGWPSTPRR